MPTHIAFEPKNDPKDRINIEIGDSKQGEFYPQVKLIRWDEVNMSFRLTESLAGSNLLVDMTGNTPVYKFVKADKEVHFYELPESPELPEGGFEMEVILKEKPVSNVLEYTIETKGLDFFYQPELTQEEIDNGNVRPDNVVGSYAVYHKTKGGMNDVNGMDYKTGQAFMIYRPKIYDANDDWVWGELNIDAQAGTQTVTIPQDFLDNAVYPVRHASGETFGYTTIGSSSGTVANWYAVKSGTPGEATDVDSVTVYSRSSSGTDGFKLCIWDKIGTNNRGDLLTNGVAGIANVSSADWYQVDYSTKPSVVVTDHWVGGYMENSDVYFYYNTGGVSGTGGYGNDGGSYSTPANWLGNLNFSTYYVSVYATYGGSTPYTFNASTQVVTASLPQETVTTVKNITTSPAAQVVTSSIPVYAVDIDAGASPSEQSITVSIPAYTVHTSVLISETVQDVTTSLPNITITAKTQAMYGYNSFKKDTMNGDINLASDTIKVMLVSSSYTFNQDTHTVKNDITNEISGGGYSAGGATLAGKDVSQDDADDEGVFDASNIAWTSATFTASAAVIYKDTGDPNTSPLVAYYNFGADHSPSNETLTITWNVEGIVNLG